MQWGFSDNPVQRGANAGNTTAALASTTLDVTNEAFELIVAQSHWDLMHKVGSPKRRGRHYFPKARVSQTSKNWWVPYDGI